MEPTKIEKGWGHEMILESNEQYCFKLLCFAKEGHQSSFHFHKDKTETWLIQQGKIQVELMDMSDSSTRMEYYEKGQVLHIPPMTPHQVTCLENDTVIIEASSEDKASDNYRIKPGDSQRG